ncbi:MAG: hypothetical protein AAF682_25610 [Planctomycetota bacterium]
MSALAVHVAATWALVGLIWVVQLVIYPSFAFLGSPELPAFHDAHCRRITWIVAPLMGVELLSAVVLLAEPPEGASAAVMWAGAALIAVNWACTGLVSVPLHARLVSRQRPEVQARLVVTNWVRTASWSLRGVLVALLLP